MFKEFKDFAVKGNLIDIAVGLVMATAFGAEYLLSPEVLGADGKVATPKSAVAYGKFITTIINFLIIAWVMFLIVKAANKMKEPPAAAGPSTEDLLTQIRDLLKR